MTVIWIIVGIVGVVAFGLLLWHYHRQEAFQGSDHVVPEEYD